MTDQPVAGDGFASVESQQPTDPASPVDEGWTDVLMMAGLVVLIVLLCALLA